MTRNIKLIIEYEGTKFHGWQYQPNCRTVQLEIEEAIFKLTEQRLRINGAGRTDAGVHALGQVANFYLDSELPIRAFCEGLNSRLPQDVKIRSAEDVPQDFDARRNATSRHYRYQILRRFSPIMRRHTWTLKGPFDLTPIQTALPAILGAHDFQSFCATQADVEHYLVNIFEATWKQEGELIVFDVHANRFLHHMVRILVGTFVEIGVGKRAPAELSDILVAKNRARAGITAPADGLFLVQVDY